MRQPVACPAALAFHDQAAMIDEIFEAVLQRAARRRLLQRIGNLLRRRPARVAAHGLLDRLQFLFQDAPYHIASLSWACICMRNLAWICAIFNDTRNHPALRANIIAHKALSCV